MVVRRRAGVVAITSTIASSIGVRALESDFGVL
jgi:hypothetical protein